jgi:hypothetical protein
MDIHQLLNSPNRPRIAPSLPLIPPLPRTSRKQRARETTQTDRIRIKTALDWGTPRTVWKKYKDKYRYTLWQILDT